MLTKSLYTERVLQAAVIDVLTLQSSSVMVSRITHSQGR